MIDFLFLSDMVIMFPLAAKEKWRERLIYYHESSFCDEILLKTYLYFVKLKVLVASSKCSL